MRVWKDCSCVWIETKMDNVWEKKQLDGIFTVYELKTHNFHYLCGGGVSLFILQHFKRLEILKIFMSRTFFVSCWQKVYLWRKTQLYVCAVFAGGVDKFYSSNLKKKIPEFSEIHLAWHTVRSHFLILIAIDENIRM